MILSDKKTYDDKRYIGNAIPALMVSWDHTFTYKNLSLGINLRSWIDFDVFNTINMYYGLSEVAGQNVLRNAYIDNRHIKEVKQLCDYWLEDGTFLKIDAISLGYSLNMKKGIIRDVITIQRFIASLFSSRNNQESYILIRHSSR